MAFGYWNAKSFGIRTNKVNSEGLKGLPHHNESDNRSSTINNRIPRVSKDIGFEVLRLTYANRIRNSLQNHWIQCVGVGGLIARAKKTEQDQHNSHHNEPGQRVEPIVGVGVVVVVVFVAAAQR